MYVVHTRDNFVLRILGTRSIFDSGTECTKFIPGTILYPEYSASKIMSILLDGPLLLVHVLEVSKSEIDKASV
jgi:hypothetical protein